MKKLLAVILALIMITLPLASCEKEDKIEGPYTFSEEQTDYVRLKIITKKNNKLENVGEIIVQLNPEVAPITVANFKKLVAEGFYDGLIFHRVINNFMIQGGDPLGTGIGGSDENITGEFANNGIENNISHVRGTISMARNGYDMNSASSQFFIVHKDSTYLDGDYAAFGSVVYGIETVDKVAVVSTNSNDKPFNDIIIESAKFVSPTE
jgi:peptidyl-prolyl cis-trans isomerase B (cyclophilin B)